jgi:hypothetical protein
MAKEAKIHLEILFNFWLAKLPKALILIDFAWSILEQLFPPLLVLATSLSQKSNVIRKKVAFKSVEQNVIIQTIQCIAEENKQCDIDDDDDYSWNHCDSFFFSAYMHTGLWMPFNRKFIYFHSYGVFVLLI